MTEFNLSETFENIVVESFDGYDGMFVNYNKLEKIKEDIKEFIRLLKKLSVKKDEYYSMMTEKHYICIAIEDLNKLAGPKLNGENKKCQI